MSVYPWPVVALGELAAVQGGIQKQPKRAPRDNAYPFLRVANVTSDGLELSEIHQVELFPGEIETYRLEPGDLLVVEGNGSASQIGRAAVWDGAIAGAVHQNHLIRIRSGPRLLPGFLGLLWNSPRVRDELSALASSTSGLHTLSVSKLKRILLPVPSLDEQRHIVSIVEEHLSVLYSAGRAVRDARSRAENLLRSVNDRVASGLALASPDRDGLANGWEWRTPDEVTGGARGAIVIGPFGSDLKTSDYRDAGVPLVFVRNVRAAYFGNEGARFVSIEKAAALESHEVRSGDLLITKMGEPPGDAAVYTATDPGIITADVIRLRPSPTVDPDYLSAAVNSSLVRRQIVNITRGVAQKKVSLARFRAAVRIPVPSLELQREALQMLKPVEDGVARLDAALAMAQGRGDSLRRAVLAAAFSGRLTGRSSDTEVISELTEEPA